MLREPASYRLPPNSEHRFLLRRLLKSLSKESDIVPQNLYLNGVLCPDKINPVAVGSFASVFHGKYSGKLVALKRVRIFEEASSVPVIKVGSTRQTPRPSDNWSQEYTREALVWCHLQDQHVLPFLGIDRSTFPDYLCFVSPWMQRGDVMDCMNKMEERNLQIPYSRWVYVELLSPPIRVVLTHLMQLLEIAQGLAYLHNERVVHGDLYGVRSCQTTVWERVTKPEQRPTF